MIKKEDSINESVDSLIYELQKRINELEQFLNDSNKEIDILKEKIEQLEYELIDSKIIICDLSEY